MTDLPRSLRALGAALILVLCTSSPALAADGDLDGTFGSGGKVTRALGAGSSVANDVVVDGSGRPVVVGQAGSPFIARFTSGGGVDTTFGTMSSGSRTGATLSARPQAASWNAVALDAGGRPVAVGYQDDSTPGRSHPLIARFTTSGDPDTSFGGALSGGFILENTLGSNRSVARAVAIQPDGKIVVVGSSEQDTVDGPRSRFLVMRYTADGLNDETFNAGATPGRLVLPNEHASHDAVAKAVVVQSDGSIAIAGVENNGTGASYHRIDRVTSTGQLDTSWGNTAPKTGRVLFRVGTHRGRQAFEGLAQQSDGTLVAVGRYYAEGGPTQWAVADFAGTGGETPALAVTDQGTNFATLFDVTVQDNKILAAGEVNWTWGVARWLPSTGAGAAPQPDTSFGTGGRVTTSFGGVDEARGIALRGGRATVAGVGASSPQRVALARYVVGPVGSEPSPPQLQAPPSINQASPVVEGTTLTSTTGTWNGFTELRVRWQRCATADPATADCPFIRDDGSTGSSDPLASGLHAGTTYVTTGADVGKHVRAFVRTANASGSSHAWTATRRVDAKATTSVEPTPHHTSTAEGGGDTSGTTTAPAQPAKVSVPIITWLKTGRTKAMPSFLPQLVAGRWRFTDVPTAKSVLEGFGLNVSVVVRRLDPDEIPKAQLETLRASANGPRIIKTDPAPGTTLATNGTIQRVVTLLVWDPNADPVHLLRLEKPAERKQAADKTPSRCELLYMTDEQVRRLLIGRPLKPGSGSTTSAEEIIKSYKCIYEANFVRQRGFVDFTTLDAAKKQDRGGYILLKVAQPVVPDFAVVLYEDPARLTSANDLGPSRDWTLPVSKRQSTRCVVQVLEIATGRLVSGASVSLFSQNTDKLIGTHVTNGSGEAAFSLTLPERDRIEISAEYRATNGRRLEGFRSFPVADLGTSYVTTTGRTLTRSDGTYSGKTLELSRARKLPFSPGNLGTGVGTATKSIPAVQPGEAVRPTADGLIVGRHNVVALGGSNVLVASAPGMVLLGGDPVTAGAASARRAPGDPAIARAANLGGAMGGLLMSVTSTVKHAWDAGAGAVRTYVTEPISRKIAETVTTLGSMGVKPVASRLRPEKLGVVSASRGNVAPPKASVVSIRGIPIISTDGGTLISNDGGTLISTDGGTLISNDGGTLISTDGGTLIGQAGGNVISVGGGNVNLMPAYGGSGLIGQAGGNLISENGLG